jgi:hypothetical protein
VSLRPLFLLVAVKFVPISCVAVEDSILTLSALYQSFSRYFICWLLSFERTSCVLVEDSILTLFELYRLSNFVSFAFLLVCWCVKAFSCYLFFCCFLSTFSVGDFVLCSLFPWCCFVCRVIAVHFCACILFATHCVLRCLITLHTWNIPNKGRLRKKNEPEGF